MPTIVLKVDKEDVWNEVAKTASYTGDKLTNTDESAYDRILITDEDQECLGRFWEEAVAVANTQLKEMIVTASTTDSDYHVILEVPGRYDIALTPSVEAALRSYFISSITGKWYKFCNKTESEGYMTEALGMMADVLRKLYSRKRPIRPLHADLQIIVNRTPIIGQERLIRTGCCERNKQAQSVKNTLVFIREELLYDIESYAFVTGDLMQVAEEHLKHQVFDISQGGNEDLTTRMLNLAHAECVEFLYPYTKGSCIEGETLDDTLTIPEKYEIELTLPMQFSRATVLLLRELIHDYFICRVLSEWFGETYPTMRSFWKERLEELKARMRSAIISRRGPLRRKQSMF